MSKLLRLLFVSVLVAGFGAVSGCANRGMVAPSGSGGGGGSTDVRVDIPGMDLGSGGGGSGGTDSGTQDVPREPYEAMPPPCNNRFNFEEGMTHGAKLGAMTMMEAFKSVSAGTEHTQCGFGALQIMTQFSGTAGNTIRGIVQIDLPAPENLAGKTFTIGTALQFPATPGPTVSVSFITPTGFVDLSPTIKNIPVTFLSTMYTIPANATAVSAISIQAIDLNNYSGRIYIDEIGIK